MSKVNQHHRAYRFVIEATERAIKKIVERDEPKTANKVKLCVAYAFGIKPCDLAGRSMWWLDVEARQIAAVLACRFTDKSYAIIATHCGLDHSSIGRAVRKHDDMIDMLLKQHSIAAPRRLSREEITMETLGALITTSVGGQARIADILPNKEWNTGRRRMERLGELGFAAKVHRVSSRMIYWRATQAGREVYSRYLNDRMKLLAGVGGQRRGGSDSERVFAPPLGNRPSTEFWRWRDG